MPRIELDGFVIELPDSTPFAIWDGPGRRRPEGWRSVDLVIETPSNTLLVELTRYDRPGVPLPPKAGAALSQLVKQEVVPKVRDTWCERYLLGLPNSERPCRAVAVVALPDAPIADFHGNLKRLEDTLRAKLVQESDQPWGRPYALPEASFVIPPEEWARVGAPGAIRRAERG